MAIKISQGFNVLSQDSIDSRIVMTKAEMASKLKGEMPNNYFCICRDDGKLYIWNSAFEKTETLGRFKSYEEIMDISDAINKALESEATKKKLQEAIADTITSSMEDPESEQAQKMSEAISKTVPDALSKTMETEEGAKKIASALFASDHFEVTLDEKLENKIDLAIDLISAIGNTEEE